MFKGTTLQDFQIRFINYPDRIVVLLWNQIMNTEEKMIDTEDNILTEYKFTTWNDHADAKFVINLETKSLTVEQVDYDIVDFALFILSEIVKRFQINKISFGNGSMFDFRERVKEKFPELVKEGEDGWGYRYDEYYDEY